VPGCAERGAGRNVCLAVGHFWRDPAVARGARTVSEDAP
jgi:hypothetical protein